MTDSRLSTVGVGALELVPRRIPGGLQQFRVPALNYSNPHRYAQMPLNHMGYVVDYADILSPLPRGFIATVMPGW